MVVGGRVNPGWGGGRARLREVGMGGFLAVPLIYYEVEDSQCRRCSEIKGNHRGRGLRELDTPNEVGVGGGGARWGWKCGLESKVCFLVNMFY